MRSPLECALTLKKLRRQTNQVSPATPTIVFRKNFDAGVDAILEPWGYSRVFEGPRPGEMHQAIGYSVVPNEDIFAIKERNSEYLSSGPGFHLAFSAPSRDSIDMWHKRGIEMGAKDKGAPKIWSDFSPNHYAGYLTNLDGWQIEAVFKTIQ